MKTKQIIRLAALVCSLVFTNQIAMAQEQAKGSKTQAGKDMSPEAKAKQETQNATKKLGLSADQASSWEKASLTRLIANKPYMEKMQGSTTPQERKELKVKLKENGAQFDNTVNGFLNAEQKGKWEEWKKEKRAKAHQKMNNKKMSHDDIEE